MNIVIHLAGVCVLTLMALKAGQIYAIIKYTPIQECIDAGTPQTICLNKG